MHFNIPGDAVKYASLGGDLDRYKALVADVVDAAVVSGEYTPIAAKEHIKMLVSAQQALPLFLRMCLHATGATVAARPHDAAKFLAGEMLGLRYAVAHKDEVLKVTQQVTGVERRRSAASVTFTTLPCSSMPSAPMCRFRLPISSGWTTNW